MIHYSHRLGLSQSLPGGLGGRAQLPWSIGDERTVARDTSSPAKRIQTTLTTKQEPVQLAEAWLYHDFWLGIEETEFLIIILLYLISE